LKPRSPLRCPNYYLGLYNIYILWWRRAATLRGSLTLTSLTLHSLNTTRTQDPKWVYKLQESPYSCVLYLYRTLPMHIGLIHGTEPGDPKIISYGIYGDPGWEGGMEMKEGHAILDIDTLERGESLTELENRRKFSAVTFAECLWGRLRASGSEEDPSVRVLYRYTH
jgi:hypothetical protein